MESRSTAIGDGAFDEGAADALALALVDDGHASQLDLVLHIGLDQLEMRDDVAVVCGDQYTALIHGCLQPLRRILGESEQAS
jgi:hypothetical protein